MGAATLAGCHLHRACRDEAGALAALEIEHYPGMAEEEITRVAQEAASRWPLEGIVAIHRYGLIRPGEPIVLVVTASTHRTELSRLRRSSWII